MTLTLRESSIRFLKTVLNGVTEVERDLEYRDNVHRRFTVWTSRQRELNRLDATRDRARSAESLSRFRIFTTSSEGKSSMGVNFAK